MAARKCIARYRQTKDSSDYYTLVNKQYDNTLWNSVARRAFERTSEKLCVRHGLPYWKVGNL